MEVDVTEELPQMESSQMNKAESEDNFVFVREFVSNGIFLLIE
jgi:hypothetical protein